MMDLGIKEAVKTAVHESVAEMVTGAMRHLLTELTGAAYIITLLGGTICIILYVAGWEKGIRYTGIMFVGYILLRAVTGGI